MNRSGVETLEVPCLSTSSCSLQVAGGKLSTSVIEFLAGQEVSEGMNGGNEKGRGDEVVVDDMDGTRAKLKGGGNNSLEGMGKVKGRGGGAEKQKG